MRCLRGGAREGVPLRLGRTRPSAPAGRRLRAGDPLPTIGQHESGGAIASAARVVWTEEEPSEKSVDSIAVDSHGQIAPVGLPRTTAGPHGSRIYRLQQVEQSRRMINRPEESAGCDGMMASVSMRATAAGIESFR